MIEEVKKNIFFSRFFSLSLLISVIFNLFSCNYLIKSRVDSYLKEGKFDEAISELNQMSEEGDDKLAKEDVAMKILAVLADKGLYDKAKAVGAIITRNGGYFDSRDNYLTIAFEKTANNLIAEKKYREVITLIQEANHVDSQTLYGFRKSVISKAQSEGITQKDLGIECENLDDCIAQYDFQEARKIVGNYMYASARTKDLIKIIKAETAYWIGKGRYEKAEEVANEIGGIDPKFFDNSFFGNTAGAAKNAEEYANNFIDEVKISIVEHLVKNGKIEEARRQAKLVKNKKKRERTQSQLK